MYYNPDPYTYYHRQRLREAEQHRLLQAALRTSDSPQRRRILTSIFTASPAPLRRGALDGRHA